MTISLPRIDIIFKQLAQSFIERSERGVAVLIVKDNTNILFSNKTYRTAQEVAADEALYTVANFDSINDALLGKPSKVIVIRIATTGTVADALPIIESVTKTGWVTMVGETADYTALINWIKANELLKATYKAVVFNATAPDTKHVVNFVNANVVFSDARGSETGDKYCPSIAGILAGCNIKRGSTYYNCSNLTSVTEVVDNDAALNAGKFILINDMDKVVIGLGINSLTTFDADNTEDTRYIDVIEAMDLIVDDIRSTFKNDFLGAGLKNNYDNQVLFISAVNNYYTALENEDVLDNLFDNKAYVSVEKQRAAWVAIKPEAIDWTDAQVRNAAYKRSVFLGSDIKINGSMENLSLEISMN